MRDRRSLARSFALTSALLLAAACGSSSPAEVVPGGPVAAPPALPARADRPVAPARPEAAAHASAAAPERTGGGVTPARAAARPARAAARPARAAARRGPAAARPAARARRGAGGTGGGKIPIGMAQCSDGKDNDGDGKVDYNDPECVGPLDNDEGSFATGIPGDNMRRLQAGLLLRRQLGRRRRRLRLAAQVRSAQHEHEVPIRPAIRQAARE